MRVTILIVALFLISCSSKKDFKETVLESKQNFDELYLRVDEVNKDIDFMSSLYDSSLIALSRNES